MSNNNHGRSAIRAAFGRFPLKARSERLYHLEPGCIMAVIGAGVVALLRIGGKLKYGK